ncbi:aromatase/cyclase [Streptomyces sp. S186]|uniref:aromatase/cyclase n=1 Tax=Streptomyces sp. S186 TaxID=3434395 RepID=UPI003F663272
MSRDRIHQTAHHTDVAAPAGVVYGLLADATRWPQYLAPNVYVERLEHDATGERLRMWATANGQVKSWTSRRLLDIEARKIEFRQERSAAPVASMTGTWIAEPTGPQRTRLTLLHTFSVIDDRPADVTWVEQATDRNSRTELANIRDLAESWQTLEQRTLTFEDSVRVQGSADAVYEFLYHASRWPERLPHVARLDLTEDEPGVQTMEMETRTADGSTHTTESVRVCFPHARRIVYKQTTTPALMTAHTGEWSISTDETGTTVTSQHSVLLRESAVPAVLGADAGLPEARAYVREALGRNSTATMNLAREYAEKTVPWLQVST